jgi:transmembrane sensor
MSSSARLRTPLGAGLEGRIAEGRVHRLWQRIEAARARRRLVVAYATSAVAFAAAVCVALAVWFGGAKSPVALRLASGADVPASLVVQGAGSFAFDDGSRVALGNDTRLDVLESNGHVFELAQRRGTARFEVRPGGPRVWRVQCAGVTIEVVGTQFTVTRQPASVRVSVARGAVLVRGDRVPDEAVRLVAGQSLTVPLGDPPSNPAANRQPVPPASSESKTPPSPSRARTAPGSTALAPDTPGEVQPESNPSVVSEPVTFDTSLGDADTARRESRFADAARILERAISMYSGDPRVAIAEFSLGRLYLDSLGDAPRAVSHFEQAVASGRLPLTLKEDAQARLVEALSRAGDSAGAERAATRYRMAYPAGRRAADVERWAPSIR